MDYRVIKENDLFLLTDKSGNIPENHTYGLGLYTKDTRFLSKWNIKINGKDPVLLSSDADENHLTTILLTNPHMEEDGNLVLWRESVQIERKRFIYDDVLYESLNVKNYYPKPVSFELEVEFDADFQDMFIVRGFQTGKVGQRSGQQLENHTLSLAYQGTDEINRYTHITWDKEAEKTEGNKITFRFSLNHSEEDQVMITIVPQVGEKGKEAILPFEQALNKLTTSYKTWEEKIPTVKTDYKPLEQLVKRGMADLRVLLTDLGYGQFPVAGLPWYGVPFGRDSLITALQLLPFHSEAAKGTLITMAQYQGKNKDPWRDEEPGKIMHEIRFGELANTNQIPFTPYYGTIDATPLFLILLVEYVKWTGDYEIVEQLQENIDAALNWINEYGDRDGDLFLEYHQESSKGIANQGWKDSGDSIVHRSGDYAHTPIALSEVQGYVYQAKSGLADIYEAIGRAEEAEALRGEAKTLQQKFDEAFWMDDVSFYAIALDGNKQQVGTITSNPGHLLMSGMLSSERVDAVAKMLLSSKMFSGYGIRTMGGGEAGYNPMSYHDGSVWPHDNSLIVLGLSKEGKQEEANKVIQGLIDASAHFEYDRLPELFCGYSKEQGKPVLYPVACSPQAWAAGTPLLFVQSILGMFPDSTKKQIHIRPHLLPSMNELSLEGIAVGNGKLSLTVRRENGEVAMDITENTTGYEIVTR
ncbi:glycogen debranching N-terminal domain-containing protein [Bacillus songklensis]|uniref:Glycogen debranching N-terminal domain-containing protein n=1 Tax=Bacillus songklensis TaxID=1069116 RepID=A0ABV8B6Q4_9BACI